MTVATLPQEKMLHAIEILGTKVAPFARSHLTSRFRFPDYGEQAAADIQGASLK
jgi:hypothetical protein